jgi:CBS-domain-containing membrane protein
MKVLDVMTSDVTTVAPDTPLKDVAQVLTDLGVSGLPVVEGGAVVGVVSEADILVKERGVQPPHHGLAGLLFSGGVAVGDKLRAVTAGEAMTSPAITIAPGRAVSEAAGRMIDANVNRLPVVNEDGALVGIVTRADLVRAFVRADEEIAREIREDVVMRTLWIEPEQVSVVVAHGAVRLAGHVGSRSDAELAESLARRVPGVVSVESSLSWDVDGADRASKKSLYATGR